MIARSVIHHCLVVSLCASDIQCPLQLIVPRQFHQVLFSSSTLRSWGHLGRISTVGHTSYSCTIDCFSPSTTAPLLTLSSTSLHRHHFPLSSLFLLTRQLPSLQDLSLQLFVSFHESFIFLFSLTSVSHTVSFCLFFFSFLSLCRLPSPLSLTTGFL